MEQMWCITELKMGNRASYSEQTRAKLLPERISLLTNSQQPKWPPRVHSPLVMSSFYSLQNPSGTFCHVSNELHSPICPYFLSVWVHPPNSRPFLDSGRSWLDPQAHLPYQRVAYINRRIQGYRRFIEYKLLVNRVATLL